MRGGDELITNVPTIIDRYKYRKTSNVDRVYSAYNLSSVRVAKGDFIRMKEISLAYDSLKHGSQIHLLITYLLSFKQLTCSCCMLIAS